jgi:hypothetical protein
MDQKLVDWISRDITTVGAEVSQCVNQASGLTAASSLGLGQQNVGGWEEGWERPG